MHLLAATPGTVSTGEEAIDLGQSTGEIVILTVADSELACFARAAATLGDGFPSVRLANLLVLRHPYSVDLYVEQVIAHARFVCVVLLGGKSYWPYGIDEIAQPDYDNPAAARARADAAALMEAGEEPRAAVRRAGARVFGSKPGAYGAGLQAMIDERLWHERADLAEVYLDWGGFAYGAGVEGDAERGLFARRLAQADAVVQNQDNREHDLLDSDDYYQFEGGIAAAVEHLSGRKPVSYHNDHSRPERPVIRTLEDEIGRVVRARVVNPKWIAGVMRHGYKGAFEIAATVDYLFAFAATTDGVRDHHFDAVYAAFIEDEAVRGFMAEANPAALRETAARLAEALERGLWRPRSNSAGAVLAELRER